MSRARQFIRGVSTTYLQVAVMAICNLWLTPFLLRHVGETDFGGWLILGQLLIYLELIDFGVTAVLPREIAYATGAATGMDERASAVSGLLVQARRILWKQVPLAIVGAGIVAWLVSRSGRDFELPALAVAAIYVVLYPLRIYPVTLQGLQDLGYAGWINLGGWLAGFLTTVVLVYCGFGVWGLVIGWGVFRAFVPLASWIRFRLGFAWAVPRDGTVRTPASYELLVRGGWTSVGQIAHSLTNGMEIVLLGQLLDPAAVILYVCSSKLVNLFGTNAFTLVLATEPAVSELHRSAGKARLAEVLAAVRQLMLLTSGLIACVVLVTNEGFVSCWVGESRYGGATLTVLLVAMTTLRHLALTVTHGLYCMGYERTLAFVGLCSAAITIAATTAAILLFGPVGAPLGLMVGVVLLTLPVYLQMLIRATDSSTWELFRGHFPWLWRFLGLAGSLVYATRYWSPLGYVELFLATIGICLLYAVVMWSVVRNSSLWRYAGPRLGAVPVLGGWIARTRLEPPVPDTVNALNANLIR